MNEILFVLLQANPASWESAIIWMQTNTTGIVCFISSFAGAIASYPFIDKSMETKIWQYTFTSWSTGFVLSYLAADTARLGVPATIAEAFITGLGGFYAARLAFNRNKKETNERSLSSNSNSTEKRNDATEP